MFKCLTPKKKQILIWCLVIVITAAMVCTLPLPTRFDVAMHGMEVNYNGHIYNEEDFRLRGWKLNYLFKRDTLKLDTLEFSKMNFTRLIFQYHSPIFTEPSNEYDWIFYTVYMSDENDFGSVKVYIDKELDWCLFTIHAHHSLIGSVDPYFDPVEILKTCEIVTK